MLLDFAHHEDSTVGSQRTGSLTASAVAGSVWTAMGSLVELGLHTVTVVVLARLLNPTDFGIMSMGMIVVGVSRVFAEVGLGPALVQRGELDARHITTAYTVTIALSLVTAIAVFAGAPVAGAFFRTPALEPVIRTLSVVFLVRGLAVVPLALMRRDLRFPELARTDVISYGLGYGLVGIGLAAAGAGLWALVAAQLAAATLQLLQLLYLRPHERAMTLDMAAFKDLFSYGAGSTAGRFANYLALKGDNLVVGRLLGAGALGIYGRAYELMAAPIGLYQAVATKVLFPTMSRVQADRRRVAKAFRRSSALTALILMPASAACFILAPEIVLVLLGSKWESVILPFRIMAGGFYFRSGYNVAAAVVRASGAVHRLAAVQFVYAGLIIGGAWAGHGWGVAGCAVGVMGALVVHYVLVLRLALRVTDLSGRRLLSGHVPALAAAILTSVTVAAAAMSLRARGAPDIVTLVLCGLAGLTAIAAGMMVFPAVFLGREGRWGLNALVVHVPWPRGFRRFAAMFGR